MDSCLYTSRDYSVVFIDGKVYSKRKYPDSNVTYSVHCKTGAMRTLTTPAIQEKIDAAIMELAHAEALEMNDAYDSAYTQPGAIFQDAFFEVLGVTEREVSIDRAHRAALRENEQHDAAIAHFARMGPHLCIEAFSETQIQQMANYCHVEALKMDDEYNREHQDSFYRATPMMQGVWVNLNHAEALEINAAYEATASGVTL